jgi:hypothetical protein
MSCFRGSIEYAVLKKVFPSPDLDQALLDLRKRGLLQYTDAAGRYDMHPIVRHYAYNHFTYEKRRKDAHKKLAKYFNDKVPPTNENIRALEDVTPIIELYHHLVKSGKPVDAEVLYYDRLDVLYYQFGAFQLVVELLLELFPNGEQALPLLDTDDKKAFVLNDLNFAQTNGNLLAGE